MNLTFKNIYQNSLFWLLAGLVIFIPLYPKFPLLNVPGTYVAIRLEDFFIAGTIFLWIIYQLLYKRNIIKNHYFQLFLLFWFTGLVSLLSSLMITHSVIPHLGFLHWTRRIEFMLLFWIAATCLKSKQHLKYLLWVLISTSVIILFYGFGQLFWGFKVVSTVDKDFSTGILSTLAPTGRVNSTFAGQYDLAIYLSFFLIILSGLFFHVKKLWQKAGITLISLPSIILLGYTASRVSFTATIVGIALVLFLSNKRKMIAFLIILSILLVMAIPQFRARIIATVNVSLLKNVEKTYQPPPTPLNSKKEIIINQASEEAKIAAEKASQGLPIDIAAGESTNYTELEVGRSTSIRLTDEWPRALNALFKNPLLGTGYSSISLATDNDYLRALGETGVLGFLSLIFIFIILIKKFVSEIHSEDISKKLLFIITIAVLLDVVITAIFIDILEASKVACLLWIFLGVAWSQTKQVIKY